MEYNCKNYANEIFRLAQQDKRILAHDVSIEKSIQFNDADMQRFDTEPIPPYYFITFCNKDFVLKCYISDSERLIDKYSFAQFNNNSTWKIYKSRKTVEKIYKRFKEICKVL